MSRRYYKNNKSPLKAIIIVLILCSVLGIGPIGALAGVLGFAAVFVGLLIFLSRVSSKNKGYTEVKRDDRPTKNPYSVNFSKEEVEKSEALKAAMVKRAEEVRNKTTVDVDASELKDVSSKKPERKSTGDAELDKMIEDKDKAISEMHRLNDAIVDERISSQIEHLETVTEKIVEYIIEHPGKKGQVRQFFNYYLPTTIKLLNAYDRMDDTGISGTNIDGTKGQVAEMMDTALEAYDKQLDALFGDEALDVSTDIKVMENMLKAEGLTGDEITLTL